MKKIIYSIIAIFIICSAMFSCSDWTDPKANDYSEPLGHSEQYYKDLRAWKTTFRERKVTFGWFGNWTARGTSLENCMAGLPDSVDLISLWGDWYPYTLTDVKKADMEYAQKVKGIKVMACSFTKNVGDNITPKGEDKNTFWGWDPANNTAEEQAEVIRKYARAYADSVNKGGFDGFDIDHEPNFGGAGNLASSFDNMHIFIEELSKYFGPKSGTGKLLVIDGEPQSIHPETGLLLDFFIQQAYNASTDGIMDGNTRLGGIINRHKTLSTPNEIAAKYIGTENFEDHALAGGVSYTDRNSNKMRSLEGMARYIPRYGGVLLDRTAGCGSYHMEYEFSIADSTSTYPHMRNAIRIMNPPNPN